MSFFMQADLKRAEFQRHGISLAINGERKMRSKDLGGDQSVDPGHKSCRESNLACWW